MQHLQKYSYGNHQVYFDTVNDEVFINATEMARVFGKQVNEFLSNANTKQFIKVLELKTGFPVFKIIKGAKKAGTWMHRKLALKFAAWLNPDFEVWVYDIIDTLLFGNYRELKKSIHESADRKNRIAELRSLLGSNQNFQELESLQTEERQAAYKRNKEINNQMEIFS